MAENGRRSKRLTISPRLKTLAGRYRRVLQGYDASETRRLRIATELYEIALKSEHAELHVDVHTVGGRRRPKTEVYKLSDPRAALMDMIRFCNVWFPMFNPFLCNRWFGCPVWVPPLPGFILGGFLIGCWVNLCPRAGAPAFSCIYLWI